ncbi:MAG: cell division/cell wall cluster transcriptional repressor MraZ [Candidatus Komeilibacteria bacterium RIFCSPLOWO2_01_FULL_52_15]|uniref:Transcriptional regulator MraZ n=1 Tax=Candidatus Komeilibacteria bacterium RIFCSPLOWO2_01_FULL_52_15 TaxID=1798551 RepID=A0A1G2BPJ8_9BACT|nr:MAG: cell division/cell wall cluster transcriptional repressor MraZ [Candidatus Komeilibacteria bacterium RIFCSPLOWO2_01_FULL_52_15]
MLLGEFRHTLDDKNRLAIPSKFKSVLKTGAFITKGLDECLFLYPMKTWQALATKISQLPISQSRSRAFARMMLAGAMEATLDGQGRINVPEYLKQYAHLNKQVIVAGLYDRVEIWDADTWLRYKQHTEKESGSIAETLAEMGV